MADVQHSTLTGSSLHEPKSIATASSGTVYTADGAGSGTWKAGGGSVFGEMRIVNNSTAVALSTAADSTLNTDSEYTKIDTVIWTSGPVCSCGSVTFDSSGYLTTSVAGLYEVSFWASFSIDTINSLYAFKFSTDDTTDNLSTRKLMRLSGAAGDVGNIAASGFAVLPAGAKISLWAVTDKASDVTVIEAGVAAILLNEGYTAP